MSKQFLKDMMRSRQEENYLFSSIKREWVKESEEKARDFKWSRKLNPSSLWFDMCPYQEVRIKAEGREGMEAENIQYLEVGNYMHRMFQERAMKIPGLLWDRPKFKKEEDLIKLEKNWPEVPFFWEDYFLSGRIDLVLNIKDEPVVIDLKIPQRAPDPWEKYKKTLPEDKHKAQVCVAIMAVNAMGLYDKKVTRGGVCYFNPVIIPKGGKGYHEVYFDFDEELERKTTAMLVHNWREMMFLIMGQESQCSYPYCKTHSTGESNDHSISGKD